MLTFHEVIDALRQRLQGPLPGTQAQLTMAPAHRQDPEQFRAERKMCQEAAVLVPIYPELSHPMVLLIVRPANLKSHGGQISFPGGRREADEPLWQTALRETEEELGILATSITLLGALTPLYIPVSHFCVYPFVGSLQALPPLKPCPEEVAAVLRVPLERLLDPHAQRCELWDIRGQRTQVPFFEVESHRIWGATAMILAELLALLRDLSHIHMANST